jgi:hypothetical protein
VGPHLFVKFSEENSWVLSNFCQAEQLFPLQPKRTFSFLSPLKEMHQSATLGEEVVGMMMNEPSV